MKFCNLTSYFSITKK